MSGRVARALARIAGARAARTSAETDPRRFVLNDSGMRPDVSRSGGRPSLLGSAKLTAERSGAEAPQPMVAAHCFSRMYSPVHCLLKGRNRRRRGVFRQKSHFHF